MHASELQTLHKIKEQVMSEFLQYIEFHEDALNLCIKETRDILIQTAFKITEQHKKEIKMKADDL